MKTVSLAITAAAGLLFAGDAARAGDRAIDAYLQKATAEATAKVAAAGVDLSAQSLALQARVGGDGRLGLLKVVRSSGSLESDLRATQALRSLRLADTPPGLIGAQVRINLGAGPIVQAKAQ